VVAADRVVDGEGLVVGYGRAGGRERERGRESSISSCRSMEQAKLPVVFLFDSSSSLLLVEEGSNERDGSIAREEE
jgi:hypothetical protein